MKVAYFSSKTLKTYRKKSAMYENEINETNGSRPGANKFFHWGGGGVGPLSISLFIWDRLVSARQRMITRTHGLQQCLKPSTDIIVGVTTPHFLHLGPWK